MLTAALIYPHQLFEDHPALSNADHVFLVEDPLFFSQYTFHKQKLILHRATMNRFAERLANARIISADQLAATGDIAGFVRQSECTHVKVVDPCDDWLSRRLATACEQQHLKLTIVPDPHFLTPRNVVDTFVMGKQKLFFTDFYIEQRKRLGILLDNGKPVGNKWSFDRENRKKLSKNVLVPALKIPKEHAAVIKARKSIRGDCGDDSNFMYPTSHAEAKAWLVDFLEHRFADFGHYEDAISSRDAALFHSVLSPILNIGLLLPREVVDAALGCANRVPMNSLEGFLRQVIGWREFVRLVYVTRGRQLRTRNFWGFTRSMPRSFYDGTTRIAPLDHVIRNVLKSGYCHHIERLMILGNFMLLCEIHPNAVYQWFMEMFIDAYDWVMVPNVYGMSQFADGGGMTTKPYISGSSYILKMSDHKKGDWCPIWDALYWRFIDRHADYFAGNPRMAVMVGMKDKMGTKLKEHLRVANAYLEQLQ